MRTPYPIQIKIPQPCHEDWNKMTPVRQGRFCDSCKKCVVDFTSYTDNAIYQYISKHKNEEICGLFRGSQLNRPINVPTQPHSALYRYFIGVGLTLLAIQRPDISFAQAPLVHYSTPYSNNDIPKGGLIVTVSDTNHHAISNARVQLLLKGKTVVDKFCTQAGYFTMDDIEPGRYEIRIFHSGYRPSYTTGVTISPEKHTKLNATLEYNFASERDPVIKPYIVPLIGDDEYPAFFAGRSTVYAMNESDTLHLGGMQNKEMKSIFLIDGVPLARYEHSTVFQRRWWKLKARIWNIFH